MLSLWMKLNLAKFTVKLISNLVHVSFIVNNPYGLFCKLFGIIYFVFTKQYNDYKMLRERVCIK